MTLPNYFQPNTIYCGDCRDVLRKFPDEIVNLIYIDPPFFSNKKYEVIWKDGYEIRAFEDRWKGGINHYTQWMEERLKECYKVLKPTGTLFLHCDWKAVHYIKVRLDDIFGRKNFRNEIIWNHQILGQAHSRAFPKAHEHILRYTKSDKFMFNVEDPSLRLPFSDYILNNLEHDEKGTYYTRRRATRKVTEEEKARGAYLKTYVDISKGRLMGDVWSDLPYYQPKGKEKLGYPTQKPEALLDRIIKAASTPTDLVLDPMCGCGTALVVAQKLGRRWIGIDVSPTACTLIANRLRKLGISPNIMGMPFTDEDLRKLQPFDFQNWVIQRMFGRVSKRKSMDMGIDGYTFEGVPIQVKQSQDIGRNVIDNFQTALRRARKNKGVVVAFSFGKGAEEEASRAHFEDHIEIKLLTVKELLKNPNGQQNQQTIS